MPAAVLAVGDANNIVYVAVVVGGFGVVTTSAGLVAARFAKRADWRRQDEREAAAQQREDAAALRAEAARLAAVAVSNQAAEAARLVVISQEAVARLARELDAQHTRRLEEVARLAKQSGDVNTAALAQVARQAKITGDLNAAKLDVIELQGKQIHTLVNSDMTAARQAELDQSRALLVVLKRVVALNAEGIASNEEDRLAISETIQRITDLQAILADRLNAQRTVEDETDAAAGRGIDVSRTPATTTDEPTTEPPKKPRRRR